MWKGKETKIAKAILQDNKMGKTKWLNFMTYSIAISIQNWQERQINGT